MQRDKPVVFAFILLGLLIRCYSLRVDGWLADCIAEALIKSVRGFFFDGDWFVSALFQEYIVSSASIAFVIGT